MGLIKEIIGNVHVKMELHNLLLISLKNKLLSQLLWLLCLITIELILNLIKEQLMDLLRDQKNIKIRYEKNAIRIFHPNMGKIVNIDGSVYIAEEIVFHTPSEHTIDGKTFDLEMQVTHYGRSKGDIAKQVVLSILFKNSPGRYNKFLDKIDFFNLPTPKAPSVELQNDFFIPAAF